MSDAMNTLDRILNLLDAGQTTPAKDAIDHELAGEPRRTAAVSLQNHEAVVRFRQELTDGLIRVDTVQRLLGLIEEFLPAVKP